MNPTVRPNLPVVIHVPKTGGTTLIMAVSGREMPPKACDTYRHVYWNQDRSLTHSNCGDIFSPGGEVSYADRQFLLTLRRPLERLESEFYFLGNRAEYRDLWARMMGSSFPDTLLEYVETDGAAESVTKFLLGRDLFDPTPIETSSTSMILNRLRALDVVYGLTHEMSSTILNAEYRLGISCGEDVKHYRASIHKPARDSNWSDIEKLFTSRNSSDLAIYDFISKSFQAQVKELPEDQMYSEKTFKGDRYDSLLGFVAPPASRSPFEIFVKDIPDPTSFYAWIKEHHSALVHLNVMARKCDSKDGRRFLVDWISRAMEKFPHSGDPIHVDASDPLIAAQTYTLRLFTSEEG